MICLFIVRLNPRAMAQIPLTLAGGLIVCLRFYLFIFRQREREGEREGEEPIREVLKSCF